MLKVEQIMSAIAHNKELCDEERGLFIELPNGEIRELCNITFIDGKVVLRPSIKL